MKDPAFLFIEKEWSTNRTYNNNFKNIPSKSGIYLLVYTPLFNKNNKLLKILKHEILYVGSSKNLKIRHNGHEVLRILTHIYGNNVRFYFKETNNYLEEEKRLIGLIRPRFNIQWNKVIQE